MEAREATQFNVGDGLGVGDGFGADFSRDGTGDALNPMEE